jgi:hypothetical protein
MRGWLIVSTVACGVLLACAPGRTVGAAASSTSAAATAFLAKAAGVYKVRFRNELVDGTAFESENILEVVPVADDAAYVRLHLEFYNGHMGALSGIARVGKNSLIYDDGEVGAEHCVLELVWTADKVVTRADYEKTPGCRNYHGARGSLDRQEFPLSGRRTIRYMQRLKDSREFKAAMESYRKPAIAPASPSPAR